MRTFAVYGYAALCPNLFHRFAPGAKAADAAEVAIALVEVRSLASRLEMPEDEPASAVAA